MSDATPKLVEAILERLEKSEQEQLDAEIERANHQTTAQEKRLKIEARLTAAGEQVRELIVGHHEKRHSRKARRFGRRVVEMTLRDEPSLAEMFARCREEAEGITDHKERMSIYRAVSEKHDPQTVITTPLLLAEPGPVAGLHRFEFGWKFALKDGRHKNNRNLYPIYAWRQSPLYIFRSAREMHSREDEDELVYTMFIPGDMHPEQEPELKAFTDGVEDDELAMTGKDVHLHALGLMQEAVKVLSFKRSK